MSVPDILPPSPPTTHHRDRYSIPMPFKPVTSTPNDSPASFPPSSGAGTRKRVEFSPWPNMLEQITTTPTSNMTALKTLPPSRDCQTSSKSILKPFAEPVVSITSFDGTNDVYTASPETMEMIAQQLANNNKGSSLDAYQTLSQIIKAYDEVPEDVNTRSCIANILRCIKRDLSLQDQTQSSPIDTNMMTQALKVSVILVWSEHLSPLLTDEFRVFIIDRSINAIAEHTAPKVIIMHYMHLLAMQNFRSSIMSSSNRAVKLLEALQDITNHVQGKGAVAERLLIYQKLIDQAKPIMKARASLWIKELFLGLSSSIKDVREKAISVCTRACTAFPSSPTMSAAAREALITIVSDKSGIDRSLNFILTQRLEKMVAAKDEATQVPQIWALAMLLCHSIDNRMESWSLLRDWLKVIQRCFNCSDNSVKSQAFPAWNRFIHISKPHEASDIVVAMLVKPIMAQIERTNNNATGKGLRPAAVSTYCMLLYHAFRPAATHKQYTRMWNEYIVRIMGSQFLSKSTANADLCSRIMMALMWKDPSASRIWNENRAHENTLLEPEELPTIDCKWVRSKTEAVLHIFKLLFKFSVWGPSVQLSDQAYVAKAWRHFLKAIRESASKEVKPSNDTRKALSHILQFVQQIPSIDNSLSESDNLHGRAQLVCNITVTELGSQYFLNALELDPHLRTPITLSEILRDIAGNAIITNRDRNQFGGRSAAEQSPQLLERALKMLDDIVLEAYEEKNIAILQSGIEAMWSALTDATPAMSFLYLISLQESLSVVLEDKAHLALTSPQSSSFISRWKALSETIIYRCSELHVSAYEPLDDLLASLLLSSMLYIRNSLLKAWSNKKWKDETPSYGPRLLAAINSIQRHAEVHLPGIHNTFKEPDTQIWRDVQTDSLAVQEHASDQDNYPDSPAAADGVLGAENELSRDTGYGTTSKQEVTVSAAKDKERSCPDHNNSQVVFLSVDTTPRNIDDIESQFLTERQKEVRERQRVDQDVTFPDLRSSPRPRSARGSRAPSADCEMARKVAAMVDLPSTPTINRLNEILDEDELPSPTPKAKNKTLEMVDVDIPSSPPSVIGNKGPADGFQDIPSSPPKAQTDIEIDIVDLENANLADKLLDAENEEPEALSADLAIEPLATPKNHEELIQDTTEYSVIDSNLASAVLETVQEAHQLHQVPYIETREASPSFENDQSIGGDDIDELSASQLSQTLDQHIAEEFRSTVSPKPVASNLNTQKRKKRTISGYADQDRKKRRRRTTAHNETSLSSIASDDSIMISNINGELDAEDCIIVSTSPPITPNRQRFRPDVAAGHTQQDVIIASTGKRQGLRQKFFQMPLHTRAMSDESKLGDMAAPHISEDNNSDSGHETETMSIHTCPMVVHGIDKEKLQEEDEISSNQHIRAGEQQQITHPALSVDQSLQTPEIDVMNALKMALQGLENMKKGQANFDLKAIDDLCFKIRYQAQEVIQGRSA